MDRRELMKRAGMAALVTGFGSARAFALETVTLPSENGERPSHSQKVGVKIVTAVGHQGEIADLVRGLESSTDQVTAGADMFHPWQDEFSEPEISPGLPSLQTALFDQFIAEPTKSKCRLVVLEVRTRYLG